MRPIRAALPLLLAACSRSPTPTPTPDPHPSAIAPTTSASAVPSTSAQAPSSAAAITPTATEPAAIVWVVRNKSFHSVWLEPGAAGPVVKRERPEPIVATSRGLFAYRTKIDKVKLCPGCAPCGKGPCTEPEQEIETGNIEMLPGGPSKQLGNYPTPNGCADEAPASLAEGSAALAGAVGSVIFVSVSGWQQSCGAAHPMWSAEEIALDLETDKTVDVTPPPSAKARLTAIAKRKFLGAYGDDGGGCLMSPDAEPDPYAASFTYDPRGVLRTKYTFTMASNYMCGTGPGHYSVAQEVFDSAVPTSMERYRKAPEWLVPYIAKHPTVGVSPLPPGLDRAAAWAAFEEPTPKAQKGKAPP